MNIEKINPFLDALSVVLPQLGFQSVTKGRLTVTKGKIENRGVTVVIGLTNDIRGNVAYSMSEEAAKAIASKMMMGMPVATFDTMAESAISELGNMLAANASIILAGKDISMDIAPPTLIVGSNFATSVGDLNNLVVEMIIDEIPLYVNIAIAG